MTNDATAFYAEPFKTWQVKLLGAKPNSDQLATMHKLGLRPGKQALACAMMLRDAGVTGSQIMIACGAPQLNRMRGLVADALCKRVAAPMVGGHTVYKLVVTAKGEQRIKRFETAAAKQAEAEKAQGDKPAKATSKPKVKRAAKGANTAPKADTATGEPAQPANDTAAEAEAHVTT